MSSAGRPFLDIFYARAPSGNVGITRTVPRLSELT